MFPSYRRWFALSGFYIMGTLVVEGLKKKTKSQESQEYNILRNIKIP